MKKKKAKKRPAKRAKSILQVAKSGSQREYERLRAKQVGGFKKRIAAIIRRSGVAARERDYWLREAARTTSKRKPDTDDFETFPEYLTAMEDWRFSKARSRREASALAKQAKIDKAHLSRVRAFAKKTPDFEAVIEKVGNLPISPAVNYLLLESKNGPAIIYALAKNRRAFKRINKLPPINAAYELGRIACHFELG